MEDYGYNGGSASHSLCAVVIDNDCLSVFFIDIIKNSNLKESSKRVPDHLNILDVDRNIET